MTSSEYAQSILTPATYQMWYYLFTHPQEVRKPNHKVSTFVIKAGLYTFDVMNGFFELQEKGYFAGPHNQFCEWPHNKEIK